MSQQPQVVITDFIHDDLQVERGVLGEVAEVAALEAQGEEELAGRIEQADAIIVYHEVAEVGRGLPPGVAGAAAKQRRELTLTGRRRSRSGRSRPNRCRLLA